MAAIEVFPDSPTVGVSMSISPRISFSYDLSKNDAVPVEEYIRSTSPSGSIDFDFDFCVFRQSFDDHDYSSAADDLFSDGKILPIGIKKRLPPPRRPPPSPPPQLPPPPPPEIQKPTYETEEKHKNNNSNSSNNKSSSFWRFKRSASLNCASGGYGASLCPLPLLSRSNSTGSTASGKRSSSNQKQQLLKSTSSSSSTFTKQSSSNHQKPPLRKNSYGGRVKINPILNVPPANLFGLGSLFSKNSKSRK